MGCFLQLLGQYLKAFATCTITRIDVRMMVVVYEFSESAVEILKTETTSSKVLSW